VPGDNGKPHLIKRGELRVQTRSDCIPHFGKLELYETRIVVTRDGWRRTDEEVFVIEKSDITEVGKVRFFADMGAFYSRGGIRWFYIRYRDYSGTDKTLYCCPSGLSNYFRFKVERQAWFEAFKSIGIRVKVA